MFWGKKAITFAMSELHVTVHFDGGSELCINGIILKLFCLLC